MASFYKMTEPASPQQEHLPAQPEQSALLQWIAEKYPSLHVQKLCKNILDLAFEQAAQLNAIKSADDRERIETHLQGAFFTRPIADAPVLELARGQFETLAQGAREADFEGHMSREFLGHLIIADGHPLIKELRPWAKERAVDILYELASAGLFVKQVAGHVFSALGGAPTLSFDLRQKTLLTFDAITASTDRPSLEACSSALKNALLLELSRFTNDINEGILISLIDRIVRYPHPEIYPVLEALQMREGLRATRKHARLALESLSLTPDKIWNETAPDLVSSAQMRAAMLERVSDSQLSSLEKGQIIVYSLKENLIEDGNDPRLEKLMEALNSSDSLVSLTAAHAAVMHAETHTSRTAANSSASSSHATCAFIEMSANTLRRLEKAVEDKNTSAQATRLLSRLEKVSPVLCS